MSSEIKDDLLEETAYVSPVRKADWLMRVGVFIVALVVVLAIFGPYIGPYDPTRTTIRIAFPPPGLTEIPGLLLDWISGKLDYPPHWMGTDANGYDIYSRVIAAPRNGPAPCVIHTCTGFQLLRLLLLQVPHDQALSGKKLRTFLRAAQSFGGSSEHQRDE